MPRSCYKCQSSVDTISGKPVCNSCRIPRKAYNRPLKSFNCIKCGNFYRTKSGNKVCKSCIHEERKHPCSICGAKCDKRAEVCLKCLGNSAPKGVDARNWRGGRTINKLTGYVRLQSPGHPRGDKKSNYVLEHILVMEKHIGRYLLPGETVHHRNLQRDDNRIENLELWSGSQPSGGRVSDLLSWAHEIISVYGEQETQEVSS